MRFRDLERALGTIPSHPAPRADLEQYATPSDLAARLLAEADALGDVAGRRVVDLGCGTGMLAIGCALLGAAGVRGIELDEAALAVAADAARRLHARVDWERADVASWRGPPADTVVMNPPFGAQSRGADRPFLEAAFATAPVVYSLHHAETRAFVEGFARERGFDATHAWGLRFPLPHQHRHQTHAVVEVDVVALRLIEHS
jgi:putative methylase